MDELMARLVTSFDRVNCLHDFEQNKKVICSDNFRAYDEQAVEQSARSTFECLKQLMGHNTFNQERYPNIENKLYFKLMEKV
jgi:hypothetical protein